MDSDSAQDYFEILLDYQYDLLFERQWGVNHTEFIFIQTAKVIQAHDNIRKSFFTKTENTLLSGYLIDSNTKTRPKDYIPDDFIWFLAHLTRWHEFVLICDKIKSSPFDKWSSNPLVKSSDVLADALSDNWEDRDFYEVFSGNADWLKSISPSS